ncbi:PIG-L family deacetylase [Clostridium sp. YIM B02505]|uniref:PIG-L family deacetylase n=1 Tax=Clostridium yunnanense TaxID=2800325 RepID=A0ABS1ETL8_9CLOT|nr:PIG-L family deacetylase [Clostridium yunnanense]MBK1812712.1 PIG-L family deacetylase [Clostridium yunnanense]
MYKIFDENEKLLVLSPHADDETLGCGGLISKLKSTNVHIVEFTIGSDVRKKEFEKIMELCQIENFEILYDDQYHLKLDLIPMFELVNKVESVIERVRPQVVAIPFPSFNQDHAIVYNCCMTALRSRKKKFFMPEIVIVYEYPQVNWITNVQMFKPNLYVDISKQLHKKVEMLGMYESQMGDEDYAVSKNGVISMAKYRGKEVSVEAAEAYEIKRLIID